MEPKKPIVPKWLCPRCGKPVGYVGNWLARVLGRGAHGCDKSMSETQLYELPRLAKNDHYVSQNWFVRGACCGTIAVVGACMMANSMGTLMLNPRVGIAALTAAAMFFIMTFLPKNQE